MKKAPCKGCNDRCSGCRSFCGDWAEYQKEKAQQYERRRLQRLGRPQPSKAMMRAIKEASKK